jgi:hypothetical protein
MVAGVLLDVRRDGDRFNVLQMPKPGSFAPGQELTDGVIVRSPSVLIADRNGKELKEPFRRFWPNVCDECRNLKALGWTYGNQLASVLRLGWHRDLGCQIRPKWPAK